VTVAPADEASEGPAADATPGAEALDADTPEDKP